MGRPTAVNTRIKTRQQLFDLEPIKLPGFRLRARSVEAVGHPTVSEWKNAFEFAHAVEEAAGYWIGDLLLIADEHPEWEDAILQAIPATLVPQTLANLKSLSKRVKEPARQLAQSQGHAYEVAALSADEQEHWLARSKDEGWTRVELRNALKADARRVVLTGRADTMHTIDVTVQVEVEAANHTVAEDQAWEWIKHALIDGGVDKQAKVVQSKARPR